jgi:hypothetical protein
MKPCQKRLYQLVRRTRAPCQVSSYLPQENVDEVILLGALPRKRVTRTRVSNKLPIRLEAQDLDLRVPSMIDHIV